MYAELFWLANPENEAEIYAYGIEISEGDDVEAVTFRRDPLSGQVQYGSHDSAKSALRLFGRLGPLTLCWAD